MQLRFTAQAERDLEEIWRYGAEKFGEDQADTYLDAFTAQLHTLSDFPQAWLVIVIHPYEIRRLVYRKTVALYQIRGGLIVIERICDGRQNIGLIIESLI